MFENDEQAVNADERDAADPSIEEQDPDNEPEDGQDDAEEQDDAGNDASDEEGKADAVDQPPQKKPQSKEDDSKFAAARREAEAETARIKQESEATKREADEFAAQYGYKDFKEMQRAEQAKRLKDSGVPDAVAQELVQMRERLAAIDAEREQSTREKAEQAKYADLMRIYPETQQMKQLPERVLDFIKAGETPVNAYRAYLIEQLRAENTALKQNDTTKRKAIGPVKGKAPVSTKKDPFLEGLGF